MRDKIGFEAYRLLRYLLTSFLCILLVGCTSNMSNEISKEPSEPAYEIAVSTDIDWYQVFMSSVPGIPIVIETEYHGDAAGLHLIIGTDQGQMLLWDEDGAITLLDDDYECSFEDMTVYWTPLAETDGRVEEATVFIKVVETDMDIIAAAYFGRISFVEGKGYRIRYDVDKKVSDD